MRRIATIALGAALAVATFGTTALAAPPEYPGGQCVRNGVQAVAPGGGFAGYAKAGLASVIILDHVNNDADFTESVLGVEICNFTD